MTHRFRVSASLVPKPPLLATECREEFEYMCTELKRELEPRGPIERAPPAAADRIGIEVRELYRRVEHQSRKGCGAKSVARIVRCPLNCPSVQSP